MEQSRIARFKLTQYQLLLFLFSFPLLAQVQVLLTPESAATSASLLRQKSIALWNVAVCNDYSYAIRLPRERVFLAVPQFRGMAMSRAQVLLENKYRTNKKLVAARIGEAVVEGGLMVTGFGVVSASMRVIAALAPAVPVAHFIGDKLRSEVPDLASILNPVLEPVLLLGSNECATRTIPASYMPLSTTYRTAIDLEHFQPAPPPDTPQAKPSAFKKEDPTPGPFNTTAGISYTFR